MALEDGRGTGWRHVCTVSCARRSPRAKDVVIRGGENIYSIEVGNVLQAHVAVSEYAVIGAPHRVLGGEPSR